MFVEAAKVGHPCNCCGQKMLQVFHHVFIPILFSFIAYDELCRCASGGTVWGITGGLGIALPPIVHAGTPNMMRNIVGPALRGDKRVALAVSEPTAGFDVANLKTTAIKSGNVFVVNGLKKWITCGMFADFFTTAVQTDPGSGFRGIQLLVIERTRKGVSTDKWIVGKGSGTAYVSLIMYTCLQKTCYLEELHFSSVIFQWKELVLLFRQQIRQSMVQYSLEHKQTLGI